jgi:hypothetical protein
MSTYSTDLKLELIGTGEASGTWGSDTNNNLNLIQQAVAGYEAIDVASGDVVLAMTDKTISNARNATLKLTGTLAANRTVTVPDSIEKVYNIIDGTDHADYTLTIKTASGTGVALCEGNNYVVYSDGTNVVKLIEERVWRTVSAAETIQSGANLFVETNGGGVTLTLPAAPVVGDVVNFVDSRYTFDANALTVGRNSLKIANATSDLVVNTEGAAFGLVYSGTNVGWTYTEK